MVKYPRTTWKQRLYIPEIIRGLMLTLKFLFRKKSTLQYPEQKHTLPVGYRGVPRLITGNDGNERCVACKLCEVVCPPVAIYIEAEEAPDQNYKERHAFVNNRFVSPPMTPRDYTIVIGNNFYSNFDYYPATDFEIFYNAVKDSTWPECSDINNFKTLPKYIQEIGRAHV
mgnify:CR=1 FL=1